MVIVTSFPITSAAAIATASGITGLTFPGIILLPGCKPFNSISDSPAKGPEFIHLRSFEIFMADIGKRKHCDGVICGHIHIPRNVNIAQINYLNTGDWTENCSAIVESENGHMSLIDWRNS